MSGWEACSRKYISRSASRPRDRRERKKEEVSVRRAGKRGSRSTQEASKMGHAFCPTKNNSTCIFLIAKLLGVKGNLKNYPNINEMNGVSTYNKMSKTLKTYIDHSTRLTSKWIRENYFFFKDDKIIQSIDAFVCTFPASMCQMWMAFEKAKIVFLPAHRYFSFLTFPAD